MFRLQADPIDPAACRAGLERPDAGACVIFEGWVRDRTAGRPVVRLEFEAFDELVRLEGEAMVRGIEQRHPGARVLCVHRCGSLPVGTMAVWIGATSPHRPAAFAACRETIEELKRRLPVWKKEHFSDGTSGWVDCSQEHNPAAREAERFARVRPLGGVGDAGLERLRAAAVLVVGAGGLGCAALEALAASGVGTLRIVDDGLVERSNLPRQALYSEGELGLPKAAAAAARLRLRFPALDLEPVAARFTPATAGALLAGAGLVLDCTDNVASRADLRAACRAAGRPLVRGAVAGFEGTLDTFRPEEPEEGGWSAEAERGPLPVFSPAAAVLGQLLGAEAVKVLLGLPAPSTAATLLVDLLSLQVTPIRRPAATPSP
jgi:sulfur-carrier protein adenylyltransferase/sulfurtransferase